MYRPWKNAVDLRLVLWFTDEIRQDMEDVIARMKPWYVETKMLT